MSFRKIIVTAVCIVALLGSSGCTLLEEILRALGRYCEATEWVVNRTDDPSTGSLCSPTSCSLRLAVNSSNACPGTQTIRIPAGTYAITLTGRSEENNRRGDLDLLDSVNILGEGEAIIDGHDTDGIFHIHSGVTATLQGLVIQNGYAAPGIYNQGTLTASGLLVRSNDGVFGSGGGLFNAGEATISHSAFVENDGSDPDAYEGGGLENTGSMTIDNVTVSGNLGCGILNYRGNVAIFYSTIAYNDEHCQIGNLGTVHIYNSIVAGRAPGVPSLTPGGLAPSTGNCWGELTSGGFNIDNAPLSEFSCGLRHPTDMPATDPRLWPLSLFGSALPIHRLDPASPAINTANLDQCGASVPFASTDQRGVARPQGGNCDRGAFELEMSTPEGTPTPAPSPTAAAALKPTATLTKNAFCRKGPAVNFFDVATFSQGQTAVIEGRNEESTWWYVSADEPAAKCWVAASTVETTGTAEGVPVMVGPHLEDPVEGFEVGHLECDIQGKKNSNRVVWQDNPEETGYRIYRNGEEIAQLSANITKYNDDKAPLGEELYYEIEALTEDAASDRVGATAPACQ